MVQNASISSDMLNSLTESQKKAVFHKDGALLVLAGPGSGKTRVIICRVGVLIKAGVRPYNICAITFTNKAAEEMRQRLAGVAGVHISTFHSLCVRLLRRYADKAGIKPNFSIYDSADQTRTMKEVIKACDLDTVNFTPSKMLEIVSRLKNNLEDVESVQTRADEYFTKILARVYGRYQKVLAGNNALDFDDLLLKTAFLLRDHPDVRAEIGNRFKYLLVDEYQDTNHAQYQIARGIAIEHGNICVTGDPDQSIYRWRGADIGNILSFENDWPDAVVVKLEENFRSTPNILEKADKLISLNQKRKPKKLIPTRPAGSDPIITAFDDEYEEAENAAQHVKILMDKGADLNNIAVFYRVNSMSRIIEEAFVRLQIPYQIVRGVEFYSRKEIRDMFSYLKLIVNPDDNGAFLRAVGTHPRGIGKTTIDRFVRYASGEGLSLYQAVHHANRIALIAKGAREKLVAFSELIDGFAKDSSGKVASLMSRVFTESGLFDALRGGGEKQQSAIENINELINAASQYDENAQEPSLLDYLQAIALYSDTDAYDASSGKVSLMTLHAAKGLEFDNVFIVGLEEGILPHERSNSSEDELEEERRLFFVGITRTRINLNISYARHRQLRGQFLRTIPSQFLYEIGFSPYDSDFDEDRLDDGLYNNVSMEKSHVPVFEVGQLLEHPKFGMGRVKEFIDLSEHSIVVVRFNSGQIKSLAVAYANLTKVDR